MKAGISLPVGVAVFAVLALAGLIGLFALTAAPTTGAQDSTFEYAEGGTEAVTTFTAADPEDEAVTWSLGDADAGDVFIQENTTGPRDAKGEECM